MEQSELFAHVNDSIRRLASEGPPTDTWEFLCECPDVTCHVLVSLTLTEFDEHRLTSPAAPILAAEHEIQRSRELREGAEALKRQAEHQVERAKRNRRARAGS